jgi:glycosyltransferase involved in cell wall biosynthesis
MTVGFFSPLPPERTGVADYSYFLLKAMRRTGDVRVNGTSADVALYHLGNNHLHRVIYERSLAAPGVTVLHDAVLNHFFLGALSEAGYKEEFSYNYGRWNEGLAERLWKNRARSGVDPLYFRYPMLRRVAERSRALIVHNAAAARMVREHVPGARVHEIPHLFAPGPVPAPYEVERLRVSLGIRPSVCLFGVFGHLRESKRLATVLRVFQRLERAGEPVALLVAGEFASRDLERSIRPQLSGPGVLHTGYTTERVFRTYAHAVDVCINLRYPTAGETSGIAIRLMGVGRPVILSGGEETAGFPEAAAIRIDPGPAEADMLAETMLWLARFREDAREIGRRARAQIAEYHDPARVAGLYWRVLSEAWA